MELEVLMAISAGKILLTRALLCQKCRLHRLIAHENEYLITSPSIRSLDLVEALVFPAHFPTQETRNPPTGNPATSHIIQPTKVTRSHLIIQQTGSDSHPVTLWVQPTCRTFNYHTTHSQTPSVTHPFRMQAC